MSTENIVSLQKLLKLTGTVQTDVISILSELAGYSKRRDLLETQLRKSGHSASGITQSIDRLLSVGLLVGKKTSAGARVYDVTIYHSSAVDYAEKVATECYDIPEQLQCYIDYEAIARNMTLNGEFSTLETANGDVLVFGL